MAADNHPNYAKIGFFILAGVALLVYAFVKKNPARASLARNDSRK